MRARKVKGLDPAGPFQDNARRIVATRLAELYSFDPHGDSQTLHDMRIAAKRLRYVLELTGPVLGRGAGQSARQAKEIQDLLGLLHDCDVMLELIDERVERLRSEDAAAAFALAPQNGAELPASTVRSLPNRSHYPGLETLAAYFRARRQLSHRRFVDRWEQLQRGGFRDRVLAAGGPRES